MSKTPAAPAPSSEKKKEKLALPVPKVTDQQLAFRIVACMEELHVRCRNAKLHVAVSLPAILLDASGPTHEGVPQNTLRRQALENWYTVDRCGPYRPP